MNMPLDNCAIQANTSKPNKRVTLLGLDFGSTTSSALVVSAKLTQSSVSSRMQLDDLQIVYTSEPVFTPFNEQNLEIEKVAQFITFWLQESGIKTSDIFCGGGMITGLAAQAENAAALSKLILDTIGESVIATADDPCLESWLAFMGSCSALSRYHANAPMINFDVGGGTTNVALGMNGDVLQTGCYFIGARHFQFVPGSYQLTAISTYGVTLLESLGICKQIGETLNETELETTISFYIKLLESILLNGAEFLSTPIAKKLIQVALNLAPNIKPKITFSGGVGELIYKISANEPLPSTTFYGDFGIDLALAITRSTLLSADLKTTIPENKGRATVMGLTLHSTEISGQTIYLAQPNCLPLRDLPIVAKLLTDATSEQWQSALTLAASHKQGACVQITAENITLQQIRALAEQIKHAMQANIHAPSRPLIILVETNIGKVLGNYICDWGQLDYNLIVIDEVALRDAHFVQLGRLHQGMIPVSFYGLN